MIVGRFNFIFGIHCHQPVGNFESVLEHAYQKAYWPFFQVMSRHPQIKFIFHCSGYLLEWFEQAHPEILDSINTMLEKGQLEILGGGYYEPILAAISSQDGGGQLRMLSDRIEARFGIRPQGIWLAERVWEPYLPELIARAGLKYAFVDDFHLLASGLTASELLGYFLSEHHGFLTALFPISEKLRYFIPFEPPRETIQYFRSLSSNPVAPLLVMVDDAEKFGIWPETHRRVYEQGWLESFLKILEENQDWLSTVTSSEFIAEHPPLSSVYLPSGSYFEMGQWTLPPHAGLELERLLNFLDEGGQGERFKPFIKGGNWLNTFVKYPESNHMHKRAQWISQQYTRMDEAAGRPPQGAWWAEGRAALYRAQCNDGYWHGVFGGIYLPHLRHAIYQNLIEAEAHLQRSGTRSRCWKTASAGDLDWDQKEEVLLATEKLTVFVDAVEGGSVYELDFKPRRFNLANNLARRPEIYHAKIRSVPENHSENQNRSASIHDITREFKYSREELQQYDVGRRGIFQDQLLTPQTDLDGYRQWKTPPDDGFYQRAYQLQLLENTVHLSRRHRWSLGGLETLVVHEKRLDILDSEVLRCRHRWTCEGGALAGYHLCGMNFSLLSEQDPRRYLSFDRECDRFNLSRVENRFGVSHLELISEVDHLRLLLRFDPPCRVWTFPVRTVSQSESGYERNYQCSFIGALWQLQLEAGEEWRSVVSISLQEWMPEESRQSLQST